MGGDEASLSRPSSSSITLSTAITTASIPAATLSSSSSPTAPTSTVPPAACGPASTACGLGSAKRAGDAAGDGEGDGMEGVEGQRGGKRACVRDGDVIVVDYAFDPRRFTGPLNPKTGVGALCRARGMPEPVYTTQERAMDRRFQVLGGGGVLVLVFSFLRFLFPFVFSTNPFLTLLLPSLFPLPSFPPLFFLLSAGGRRNRT